MNPFYILAQSLKLKEQFLHIFVVLDQCGHLVRDILGNSLESCKQKIQVQSPSQRLAASSASSNEAISNLNFHRTEPTTLAALRGDTPLANTFALENLHRLCFVATKNINLYWELLRRRSLSFFKTINQELSYEQSN